MIRLQSEIRRFQRGFRLLAKSRRIFGYICVQCALGSRQIASRRPNGSVVCDRVDCAVDFHDAFIRDVSEGLRRADAVPRRDRHLRLGQAVRGGAVRRR